MVYVFKRRNFWELEWTLITIQVSSYMRNAVGCYQIIYVCDIIFFYFNIKIDVGHVEADRIYGWMDLRLYQPLAESNTRCIASRFPCICSVGSPCQLRPCCM